jgi:hypothetical protein
VHLCVLLYHFLSDNIILLCGGICFASLMSFIRKVKISGSLKYPSLDVTELNDFSFRLYMFVMTMNWDIILLGLFVMTFYIGDSTTPSEAQVWPEAASPLVQIRAVRWHGAWELLPLTRRPEAA